MSSKRAEKVLSSPALARYPIKEVTVLGGPTRGPRPRVSISQLEQLLEGGHVEKLEIWGHEDFNWHVLANGYLAGQSMLTGAHSFDSHCY